MDSVIVSHSEVDSYLACERKHYYAFMDNGKGLERKQMSDALNRGILGHRALERFFGARKDGLNYLDSLETMNEFLESHAGDACNYAVLADVTRLTNGWLGYFQERIANWKVLFVEHEFWLNIDSTIRYPFKPDLVIEEDGQAKVVDYKFQYDFFTADEISLFPQLLKYAGALRAIGIPIKSGIYAELRYRQMKDMSGSNIYRITPVTFNMDRMRRTWYEQVEATLRVARRKDLELAEAKNSALRTVSKATCKACSFKALCIAELQGSDGNIIRQTEYTTNTYGYTPEAE